MSEESSIGVLEAMWRYRLMTVIIIVVMVTLSVGAALLVAPRAKASATIALATPPANSVLAPGISGDASLARYTAQRAGFVKSDAVLNAIAKKLGRTDIAKLRKDLSAAASATSNTMVITAEADDGKGAVALAAAAADAYRTETQKDIVRLTDAAIASIDTSSQQVRSGPNTTPSQEQASANTLSQLAIQASEIRTSSALFGDGVEFVIAPRLDAVTLPSLPIKEAAVGFILGLVLAATAAWIRADRQRTAA
jgi:capsular polysaccharide biosynthesis protein